LLYFARGLGFALPARHYFPRLAGNLAPNRLRD
jgi:hypothetical protein